MGKQSDIVVSYTLQQAIKDGELCEVFKNVWGELSGGKPIVATRHILAELSLAAVREIWNEYVDWKRTIEPTLPEEDRLFKTTMNGETVWVLEDGEAFTILYPEDY